MAPFLVIRIGNELLPISGLEGCGGGELAFTEYLLHFLSGDKSVRFLLFSRPFSKETQLKHLGRVNADPYALLDFLVTDPRWFGSLVGKRASELKKRMRRDIVFVPYTPQEKFFLSLIRRSLVRKPATGYLALRFYIRVRHLLKKERLSEGLLYFINRPFAFLFPKTFSFGLFMQNSHLVSRIPVVQSVINRHLERYALVDWASAFLLQEYQQRNPHHKGRILHLCLPLVHEVLASNISSLEGISFWKQNLYPAIPGKPDKTVR
ncbi:MAG: hypothetical protein Q7S65_05885, partial [Nanoarchaeota archaeon]|nr:hypothetical protein [Nanoarchaeota archaeon]